MFMDGYRPSRIAQSYKKILKIGNKTVRPTDMINCFAHAFFNLTNGILIEYGFKIQDSSSFANLPIFLGPACCLDSAIYFAENVGLDVEECNRNDPIKHYGSWKVDAYFDSNRPDYHFFLQESEGIYSHKMGFIGGLNVMLHQPNLDFKGYEYQATYMVTNRNTSASNKYNKPLSLHTTTFTKLGY